MQGQVVIQAVFIRQTNKVGIERAVQALAESTTGYLLNFKVYTGKAGNQGKRLAHHVVTDLLQNFQQKNSFYGQLLYVNCPFF